MKNAAPSIRSGDLLLEAYDFEGAREVYRRALSEGSELPGDDVLFNLGIAEEGERIAFLHRLNHLFPHDARLGIHEARLLLGSQDYSQSLAICNRLLSWTDVSDAQRLRVHLVRLEASARSINPSTFFESFQYLWTVSLETSRARNLQGKLIRTITELSHPAFLRTVTEIKSFNMTFLPFIDELCDLKLKELSILSELIRDHAATPRA